MAENQENYQVYSLQVNQLNAPLGIDERSIRFSWKLNSSNRGAVLAASQVWVASSAEKLKDGEADLWDSGKVNGSTLYADYAGVQLKGHARYWWKVAVSVADGQVVESEAAFFDTGLFADDWQAQWIWRSDQIQINDFAYLRKEIELRQPVAYAKIFASAHNVFQLYLDGERIGGYGSPAPTNPYEHKYYVAYDVTAQLTQGTSCIAAAAHYLGGNGQNYVNGLPGFRLQLEVVYVDGTQESFKSDTTWESLVEMPHKTGTAYQQMRLLSAVEDYDARSIDPEWLKVGFDKAKCGPAAAATIAAEEWPMKWQTIPEGTVNETIAPVYLHSFKDSPEDLGRGEERVLRQVFDTGRIVSGWPSITLRGLAGVTVRMRYSEDLDEQGWVKHNVCNETPADYYYDQYTMRGDEEETWEASFSYKAFRYIEVTGYPELLVPGENLRISYAHTGMAYEGSFECSNDLLNKMYQACIRTQTNNTLGQMVDCPHREQAQYLADSDLQAEALLYNFDARHVLEKVISDFVDGQWEDGTFPFVYPQNVDGPYGELQIPEWDLHYCTIMWKLYRMYGDKRLLETYIEPGKRMVDYYLGIIDPQYGLVPIDKGWHISDWPYPTVDDKPLYLTVQNVKLYQAAHIVSETAKIIGNEQISVTYRQHADQLKEHIVKHLFDKENKRFRDGLNSEQAHQGATGIALYAGVAPEEDREALVQYAASRPWECKTVLSLPLLRMLFENGQQEAAYRLINRTEYPGWGYTIAQGTATMWEGWDDIESHSHAWNGYPARMLQEYVVGISTLTPGFADVQIKPYMPQDLTFASATIPTVRGAISVRWDRSADGTSIRLTAQIPVTTNGSIVVDAGGTADSVIIREKESGGTIWDKGHFIAGVNGVKSCELSADGFVIAVDGGDYEFVFEAS
ncbi:family 78 glycoside hydrolase catalytic domain [Paenibacillus eucommiae]|uniref:alpha-L-rhamnosidase n=1 Tax=Paenibacillus eucommiae TaxID=1355755 RepID=A0ABS4JBF9_9BACL|nr:family 78 glycoside hydrolase catalytic domain [Paenibacillus eucommiae]MBP1996074.1 alpha-L-rhamnosidase [Paenibacillus eucommiae]